MSSFLIAIGLVLFLIIFEVPVAYSFGVGALLYGALTGTDVSYHATHGLAQVGAFSLLALPLFVITGTIMGECGLSERLLDFVNAFVGRRRGGLGVVTVVACALFGAISGSAAAAMAAIGKIMAPRMIKEGYDPGYVTALIACSSVLALMIPPSITMVVFAIAIKESVAECFLAAMLPGIGLAVVYSILNILFMRKNMNLHVDDPKPMREVLPEMVRTFKRAVLSLAMPIIILGGIYSGLFTPTEAAAIAFVYTLIVGAFVYKDMTLKRLYLIAKESSLLSGSVILVMFFLFTMSRGMILAQVPQQFADMLLRISTNKYVLLLIINILLFLMGMVIDDISGGILAAIILLPIIKEIGVNPLHFAAIVSVNLGLGNITPPCAPLLYMAGGVTKVPMNMYIKDAAKLLLLGHVPMVFIVTYIPQFSLFLPWLYTGKTLW
ncbi:TRAP transporter large permease [Synergistes jonesii]|uniref:TRAP transporter large permease n=1 Tax=Synergistes jonesii TaxID=2754 RepID=UPI002A74AA14|nr:TRAP transporter large permease [Synergistes jonesii]MDY2985972.1 TRAP transporter large permease [Synergistes jonesii]